MSSSSRIRYLCMDCCHAVVKEKEKKASERDGHVGNESETIILVHHEIY